MNSYCRKEKKMEKNKDEKITFVNSKNKNYIY